MKHCFWPSFLTFDHLDQIQLEAIDNKSTLHSIESNHCAPMFYSKFKEVLPDHLLKKWSGYFHAQYLLNEMFLNETREIETVFSQRFGYMPKRLKGAGLISLLYGNIGERHLTDVDLYVDRSQLNNFECYLKERGYNLVPQTKWSANNFKFTFERQNKWGNFLYVDVHTQLFWEQNIQYVPTFIQNKSGHEALALEDLFMHLVANWAYQDTFVSINKLIDLFRLAKQFPGILNRPRFLEIVERNNLSRPLGCVLRTLSLLGCDEVVKTKYWAFEKLITHDFLLNPTRHKIKYLTLKHYAKMSLYQGIRYDLGWIGAYKL